MRRLLALLPLLAVILALAPRTAGELGGLTGSVLTGTGEVVAAGAFAYQFTYQGQLRQNGAPYSGACTMRFRIFADPTSNIALFDETIQGVPVSNGLFTATIGTTSSISPTVFPGDPRYLDVTACGQ